MQQLFVPNEVGHAECQKIQATGSNQHTSIAHDQARCTQADDILQQVKQQKSKYKLSGSLNELIGSADGKKSSDYVRNIR